jgi:hypothetical protein
MRVSETAERAAQNSRGIDLEVAGSLNGRAVQRGGSSYGRREQALRIVLCGGAILAAACFVTGGVFVASYTDSRLAIGELLLGAGGCITAALTCFMFCEYMGCHLDANDYGR